jgi:hypothetical protein
MISSLILFAMLRFFAPADESHWMKYSESDIQTFYIDTTRIHAIDKYHVTIWSKVQALPEYAQKERDQFVKDYGHEFDYFSYTVYKEEIDCQNERIRILAVFSYEIGNKIIRSADIEENKMVWNSPPPNSVGDGLIRFLCRRKKED